MAGDHPPTVYLHIGTPKSGTTYVQSRFVRNHDRAAKQGLLWPGPGWGAHGAAAKEVRSLGKGEALDPEGPWYSLVDQIRDWHGDRALISMEWLVSCSSHQARAAVESLAPARVEVILSVRDLLRSFVAQWQEMMKNHRTWGWDQFVKEAKRKRRQGPAGGTFWRQHDVPAIIDRWSEAVPPDRFHLVTLPKSGADPELLWTRFCEVVGIDGSDFDVPAKDNASLGVVSSVLMQRVNQATTTQSLSRREYKRVVYRDIALGTLAPRRRYEAPLAVDPDTDRWIRARAQKMVDDLRGRQATVVGDLDDLIPGKKLEGRVPNEVSDDEVLELAVEALLDLGLRQRDEIARLRGRLRSREQKAAQPEGRPQRGATERSD
jgi:hypothetical protein